MAKKTITIEDDLWETLAKMKIERRMQSYDELIRELLKEKGYL